jgi:diguanylate cyclase (GGDEF)-like protein/PAS domain S-box-containing protein
MDVDMRELEALSSELQKERELRERMLNCVQDVVYVLDAQENKLTFISSEIALLLGYPRKNIQAWKDDLFPRLMHPEDLALLPIFHARLANIRDGETLDFQFRMRDAKGEFRWLRSREVILERSDEGEPARVLGIAEDFTSRRREEDHLREMALIDELTGLRNRRGFVAISEQYARIALRQGQQFAVFFIDLDRFKFINDTFGHGEGDRALKAAAATLEKTFRSSDIRCRFGGDEFAALAVDTAEQGSEILTSRIRRNIEEWNAASSRPYRIEFSIGNAIFNPAKNEGARAGTSPFEAALRAADQAMYRDKNARRSQRAG